MLLRVVSIRDNAVEAYMPPTFIPHVGAAVREFSKMVADKSTPQGQNPEDFDLWHIADFDDASGKFLSDNLPTRLLRGADVSNPALINA